MLQQTISLVDLLMSEWEEYGQPLSDEELAEQRAKIEAEIADARATWEEFWHSPEMLAFGRAAEEAEHNAWAAQLEREEEETHERSV